MVLERDNLARSVQDFADTCRARGIRLTPQRLEVFRQLAGTDRHPDVETIWTRVRRRMPTVSLDTVYRTLCRMEREGLVTKVTTHRDRARFDAVTTDHDHFLCTACGALRDADVPQARDTRIPDGLGELGEVTSVHVEYRGVCAACLDGQNRRK